MRITEYKDLYPGCWLTFMSTNTNYETEETTIKRKFLCIIMKTDERLYCTDNWETFAEDTDYNFLVDGYFINENDDAYETWEEVKLAYAEEFI